MKNYTHLDFFSRIRRSTLLVVAAGAFLYIVTAPSFAQEPHESSEARRVQVESSLLPDSPIAGEKGWSLTERMQYYRVPGVQIAAVKGGKLDWTRGYGLADTKTRRRVTSETVFDAGSTSKAVTAILTMKLVEQGKLSLDAPINDFLTSWKLPENDFTRKTPVTLQRLLSHTAGTNVGGFWGYLENDPLPTLTQILDGLPPAANGPVRVEAEPGKAWRYSGGGFVIIQQVIEDVTRKSFADAAEEIVFRPLGMTRSSFVQALPPALRSDAAVPSSEASYFKGKRLHPHAAAAGLYSTAADLAALIEAVYGSLQGNSGAFFTRETAQTLITPVIRDREPWDRTQSNRRNTQKDQAAGFMLLSRIGAANEATYAYYDGLNAGFRSRLMFDPSTGDGVVILYNSDGDEEFLLETARAAASVYGWRNYLPDPIQPISLSVAELARYEGRYRRSPDNVVTIRREGAHLIWTDLWTAPQPIYPIGDNRFEHSQLFGRASRFTADGAGTITALDEWPRITDSAPLPVEYLLRGDLKAGVAALQKDTSLTEERLGNMAFNLLETHRNPKAAAAVYRVVTERFPHSPGAWDALGDALRRSGDAAAGANAERQAQILRDARAKKPPASP